MATKEDVPKVQQLIGPTVTALRRMGGSGTIQEINDTVAEVIGLSEDVQIVSKGESSDTWFGYRCRWARTYLKYVDLAQNSERGIWALTEIGLNASEARIAKVWSEVHTIVADRRKSEAAAESLEDDPEATSDEPVSRDWKDVLLDTLKSMPADSFERLCQRILRESGFSRVEVTGRSGDGGIDGKGVLRLNLISFQTVFQCKRYADAVGSSVIRDFRGAMMGRADKGLIMTTGRFTSDAQREAARDGATPIELIDGAEICELLKSLKLGVHTRIVEVPEVDSKFFSGV